VEGQETEYAVLKEFWKYAKSLKTQQMREE
jgi:hypothetical protein